MTGLLGRRGAVRRPDAQHVVSVPFTPLPPASRWTPVPSLDTFLRWAPPPLSYPQTVTVEDGASTFTLDPGTDYIVEMPDTPISSELNILGGRNVRVIGGEIATPGRAVYLHQQTGSAYVEGLKISGDPTEGFDLDQRYGAAVILQNVWIENLLGSIDTNHADAIQAWAGPDRLLVDRFYAKTTYQGFFLTPRQQWSAGPQPSQFDLRRIHIDVTSGGYALWRDTGFPLAIEEIYVTPNPSKPDPDQYLWPKPSTGDTSWAGVVGGPPPTEFVDPTAIGCGYVSAWS